MRKSYRRRLFLLCVFRGLLVDPVYLWPVCASCCSLWRTLYRACVGPCEWCFMCCLLILVCCIPCMLMVLMCWWSLCVNIPCVCGGSCKLLVFVCLWGLSFFFFLFLCVYGWPLPCLLVVLVCWMILALCIGCPCVLGVLPDDDGTLWWMQVVRSLARIRVSVSSSIHTLLPVPSPLPPSFTVNEAHAPIRRDRHHQFYN